MIVPPFGRYCDGDEEAPWLWGIEENPLTILALGLTGAETKETLSMLVRHFDRISSLGHAMNGLDSTSPRQTEENERCSLRVCSESDIAFRGRSRGQSHATAC